MEQINAANKLRRQWAENDAERDAKIPAPKGIKAITDIAYTVSETKEEEAWHLTDIYFPEEQCKALCPVIVNVHGGGWFYGDKKLYSLYAKYLAGKGFAVVNFNYRLAPEYKYPCGFSDVCRLMSFVAANAGKYSFDLKRLYMTGDSAGAQLVSQYSVFASNKEYRMLFPDEKELITPVPSKIALNCGIYEIRSDKTETISDWYLPEKMTETVKQSAFHVIDYINEDFPETFLMTSVNDPLLTCSEVIKDKLEQLGIPHICREYGQSDEADGHVFHLNLISSEAQRCNQDEIDFFNSTEESEII